MQKGVLRIIRPDGSPRVVTLCVSNPGGHLLWSLVPPFCDHEQRLFYLDQTRQPPNVNLLLKRARAPDHRRSIDAMYLFLLADCYDEAYAIHKERGLETYHRACVDKNFTFDQLVSLLNVTRL